MLASSGKENDSGVAQQLYNALPESSFTRSISNPELVMRKQRQRKLEKKLQEIRGNDGGPDSGKWHVPNHCHLLALSSSPPSPVSSSLPIIVVINFSSEAIEVFFFFLQLFLLLQGVMSYKTAVAVMLLQSCPFSVVFITTKEWCSLIVSFFVATLLLSLFILWLITRFSKSLFFIT